MRDYIRFARVERAKLLLSSSYLSIREIAEHLRFCAPSHFARVFREITGELPQQ
ncbi:MAG: helix-turn-helix domain-containing protein [Ruminococcaceae bacterium]|nr:helix-turn-helix domain-containing protein [Oscillospiraceae bacterium]